MGRPRTKLIGPDSIDEVAKRQKEISAPRDLERLVAVRMGLSGEHTLDQIAQAVGRARSCIQVWFHRFSQGGLEQLLKRGKAKGNPPRVTSSVIEALQTKLEEGAFRTAPQIQRWLQKEHGIQLQLSGVYYWLKKLERGS